MALPLVFIRILVFGLLSTFGFRISALLMSLDHWHLLRSSAGAAAWNMALDEALLEAMPRLGRPVLRFYGWLEPAASFGYFQKYCEIERLTPLRPLVRRPTGGGLVPHDRDWTYSLAVPPTHSWYALAAAESYRQVHAWLAAAFAGLGVQTELALGASKSAAGQCFVGYEQSDLLWQGRKIGGAAQRRRRDGLLIQGSVQSPIPSLRRAEWEQAVTAAGQERWLNSWAQFGPDAPLLDRAEQLARQKYSRAEYNQRR